MRSKALSTPIGQDELGRLLTLTSRTFALAIPLLEEPLARQVGLAYLLFRIADELEDAPLWNRDERSRALTDFVTWLDGDGIPLDRKAPPTTNEGCLELLSRADHILASTRALDPEVASTIITHVRLTANGMRDFVARQNNEGGLSLITMDALRSYCYFVAGIVGELLTALFILQDPKAAKKRDALEGDATSFGEGLQLVNILKDSLSDAKEGRVYLPRNVAREEIANMARQDLVRAERYVDTLRKAGASKGIVSFCDLPVRLALATLDALDRGAPKLGREEVMKIVSSVVNASSSARG